MTQQFIDIGTGPGVGNGDPLRVAFDKINQNFSEVFSGNLTVTGGIAAGVSSVAGKTGTVSLTVADVAGALSQGYALNLVTNAVQSEFNQILDGAPALLDTMRELADAIANDPTFAISMQTQLQHKFDKMGGTLSGPLYLASLPTTSTEATSKQYVDQAVAGSTAQAIAAIQPKANASEVYSKAEIDALLLNITNTSDNDWGSLTGQFEDRGLIAESVTIFEDFGSI